MNSIPRLPKGAFPCALNFRSILFFGLLFATALWSAAEVPDRQADAIADNCSPSITCLQNFISQQYPVDEDGDGYEEAAVSTVRASDLLSDASSDCSDVLRFSIYFRYQIEQSQFTPQPDDPDSLVLHCLDHCGWNMVRVYVWDDNFNPDSVQPDGTVGGPNYSYCDIPVLAMDFFSVCNCDFLSIYCLVKTKEGTPLKGVSVDLDGEDFDLNGTTNVQGGCYFGYSAFGLVTPRLNTQALNGVSTVDMILIRRHILGIQALGSPYKRIAADVNNDKNITTTDLLLIRRLILGIDSTFTDNTSWRFVRADYDFPVPTIPWFEDFPEAINVNSYEQYDGFTYQAEFIAIKIGDVNASADTDLLQPGNDDAQGSRSILPERLIQPHSKPAPEYGANVKAVTDTCAPVIECVNGVVIELIPVDTDGDGILDSGEYEISALDMLAQPASSSCSDSLRISIHRIVDILLGNDIPTPDQGILLLHCDDYHAAYVRIYAWDDNYNPDAVQPDGTVGGPNYSYCDTYILVQLNYVDACATQESGILIAGTIETTQDASVKGVHIQLSGDQNYSKKTSANGGYDFNWLSTSISGHYTITPTLDTFPQNGLSTFDIILVSRHILGIQALGDPYKMIAADVNADEKITTVDLIHLRRMVLGIDATFASNTSWRFVPADYVFPMPTDPWFESFPESSTVLAIFSTTHFLDFIAIKIGDVNNSADPDPFHSEEPASRGALPERLIQPYLQPAPEYGANVKAVTDTCAPVIACISGLAIDLFPVDTLIDIDGDGDLDAGSMQVWGGDFVVNFSTACGNSVNFSLYKTADIESGDVIPDSNDGSWIFTCNDLGLVSVRIYVWDDAYNPDAVQPDGTVGGPNYTYCEANVLVQDNQFNVCSPDNTSLSGVLTTETDIGVGGISVGLSGPISMMTQTNAGGYYAFPSSLPPSPLVPYVITPEGGTDYLNGVSAMDYILIKRHILGIQPLDSPYKLIAADINNDGKITNLDLIHFQRLILQLDNGFTANSSWRFVRADYVFPDPADPWLEDFPESISTEEGSAFPFLNFIAIKIGDVNNSAQ